MDPVEIPGSATLSKQPRMDEKSIDPWPWASPTAANRQIPWPRTGRDENSRGWKAPVASRQLPGPWKGRRRRRLTTPCPSPIEPDRRWLDSTSYLRGRPFVALSPRPFSSATSMSRRDSMSLMAVPSTTIEVSENVDVNGPPCPEKVVPFFLLACLTGVVHLPRAQWRPTV
jgi:hypothetical protein